MKTFPLQSDMLNAYLAENVSAGVVITTLGGTAINDGEGATWVTTGNVIPGNAGTIVNDKAYDQRGNELSAFVTVNNSEAISLKSFGVVGDGVTDDTAGITAAILAAEGKTLYIPEGDYNYYNDYTRDAINVSNITIHCDGFIITPRGLRLEGDSITIIGGKYGRTDKSTNTNTNYECGIAVVGNYNSISKIECLNVDGPGLIFTGTFGHIDQCHLHDNQMGALMGSACSHVTVENCNIHNNDVTNNSGADGLNIQRNTDNITVRNNRIYENGEHGVYFQGMRSQFLGNEVYRNHSAGIKFGSHPTGQAPKEIMLPISGDLGDGIIEQQGGHTILIEGNSCYDNPGDNIYIQPSFKHVEICNNRCWNTNIETVPVHDGIKLTYFSGEGETDELEELRDIKVYGNSLIDCNIFSECNGTEIFDNYVEGSITLSASDGGKTGQVNNLTWHRVSRNVVKYRSDGGGGIILWNRSDNGCIAEDNDIMSFVTGGGERDSINLKGNLIRELQDSIDFTRFNTFDGNEVHIVGNIALNRGDISFGFSNSFSGNRIFGPDRTDNHVISASFNSTTSDYGIFSDNYIYAPQADRTIYMWGDNVTVTGNVLENPGASIAIDYYGNGGTFSGNNALSGYLNLREDGSTFASGNNFWTNNQDTAGARFMTNMSVGNNKDIQQDTSAPTSRPEFIGQMFIDTTAGNVYISVDNDASGVPGGWKLVTN
ncbi:parallel beta-helix repeat protein [Vibrio phage 2.275.O._10N.286.54.E11]|nr:parallel beta-helix repeat protein [Vibrio phage 2.275.O._10N.286.54.E11]